MTSSEKNPVRLFSSDLNGTLVHQHTMMDMIRLGFPDEPRKFTRAKAAFDQQTSGRLSIRDAFDIAGPLTKGLSLRTAIEYAGRQMRFIDGFDSFLQALQHRNIRLVINSTGYTVTGYAIRCMFGADVIFDLICNRLVFGWKGDPGRVIDESTLEKMVQDYFLGDKINTVFDEILAVGKVELKVSDENKKARLIFDLADRLKIPRRQVAHMGDTMGDCRAIIGVAESGGVGIAFNYNQALEDYITNTLTRRQVSGKIILVEPRNMNANLAAVLNALF